jgi:hypothetical protein
MGKLLTSKINSQSLSDLHALQFDGTNTSIVISNTITLGSELSIECFIKVNVLSGTDYICGFGTSGSADRFYFTTTSSNKIQFNVRSTATATLYSVTSTSTIVAGTVYHLCGTYSDTEGKIRLYINGVQEGGDVAVVVGTISPRVLALGGQAIGIFEGVIDNFRFYRRQLTSTEVSEHNSGIYSNNTDLCVHWNFDNIIGFGIPDLSGNNIHGRFTDSTSVLVVNRLVNF